MSLIYFHLSYCVLYSAHIFVTSTSLSLLLESNVLDWSHIIINNKNSNTDSITIAIVFHIVILFK